MTSSSSSCLSVGGEMSRVSSMSLWSLVNIDIFTPYVVSNLIIFCSCQWRLAVLVIDIRCAAGYDLECVIIPKGFSFSALILGENQSLNTQIWI